MFKIVNTRSIILMLLFMGISIFAEISQKHILFLHSYHPEMTWVKNVNKGLEKQLKPEENNIIIHYEFMDSKRFNSSEFKINMERYLIHKYENTKLSLILCADNTAMEFLMERRKLLGCNIGLIFCGVSGYTDDMIIEHENVTGVVEVVSAAETVKFMLNNHPNIKKLYVVNDYLTTGRSWQKAIHHQLKGFESRLDIDYNENLSLKELQKQISKLEENSAVLLGSYFCEKDGKYLTYEKAGSALSLKTTLPFYCLLDFNIRDGVVGGKVVSGYNQGIIMGKMVERYMNGELVDYIPVVKQESNKFIFDYEQLKKYKIKETSLPDGSNIINKKKTFFEEYLYFILFSLVTSVFFICTIYLLVSLIKSHKTSKELIKISEKRYRSIFDNATEGIFRTSLDGVFVTCNAATAKIFGFDNPAEFIDYYKGFPGNLYKNIKDREFLIDQLKRLKVVRNYETVMIKKDYDEIWVSINVHLITDEDDEKVYIEGSLRDITSRKEQEKLLSNQEIELRRHRDQLEDIVKERTVELLEANLKLEDEVKEREQTQLELEKSNELYRLLADNTIDCIWMMDIDTRFTYVNPAIERMLGYTRDEWLGTLLTEHTDTTNKTKIIEQINHSISSGPDSKGFSFEVSLKAKNGTWITFEISNRISWEDNKAMSIQGVARNITQRKKSEQERDRLISAIEQVKEIVVITDMEANIQYVNTALEVVTGYKCNEVIGQNTSIFNSGDNPPEIYADLWDKIKNGETWQGVFINKRKDGSKYVEEAVISPVKNTSGEIVNYVAVKHDISEKLHMEAQLRQSQKMEAIGQLAGGVAHDFNNILTVILGNCYLLQQRIGSHDPLKKYVNEVSNYGKQAVSLVNQLLAFSRKQALEKVLLDLNKVVGNVEGLLKRLLGENITLIVEKSREPLLLMADKTQVEQIIINLAINARDAMTGKGRLNITTEIVEFNTDSLPSYTSLREGKYARLSITDNGCGISEENIEKIFEPFFTTKSEEKGTGLGLSTVYGIVKQVDGDIQVKSKLNEETTFQVYLKLAEPGTVDEVITKEELVKGNNRLIMIVEDDPGVQSMLAEMLAELGYLTTAFLTGTDALIALENSRIEPDIVITDMIMPEMNGKELKDKLAILYPDLKVIFISGYTSEILSELHADDDGTLLLSKPFEIEDLSSILKLI